MIIVNQGFGMPQKSTVGRKMLWKKEVVFNFQTIPAEATWNLDLPSRLLTFPNLNDVFCVVVFPTIGYNWHLDMSQN